LNYLLEEMTPRKGLTPLYEIKLELIGPKMIFTPLLDETDAACFQKLIGDLVKEMSYMATLVPRIASRKNTHDFYVFCKRVSQNTSADKSFCAD